MPCRLEELQTHFIGIVHIGWAKTMWPLSVFNIPVQMFNAISAKLPDFLFCSRTKTVDLVNAVSDGIAVPAFCSCGAGRRGFFQMDKTILWHVCILGNEHTENIGR